VSDSLKSLENYIEVHYELQRCIDLKFLMYLEDISGNYFIHILSQSNPKSSPTGSMERLVDLGWVSRSILSAGITKAGKTELARIREEYRSKLMTYIESLESQTNLPSTSRGNNAARNEAWEDSQKKSVPNNIFIGHGQSDLFHKVQTHIQDEFTAQIETFERNKVAGRQVVQTLDAMLDKSNFAVIVATADDEAADGPRARQNVVHEIGLFQGRLGIERVAVLMEQGITHFLNLSGVLYLEFEPGKIEQTWTDLDKTLRKAGFMHR